MLKAFSGDAFLARRSFLGAVAEAVAQGDDVLRLSEGSDVRALTDALAHGGLFGPPLVALDLDDAVVAAGAAGAAARGAFVDALEAAGDAARVLVLDSGAPAGRQKRYRALGELLHQPTPKYAALGRWVRDELRSRGLQALGDVPGTLVDLFGEDVGSIAAEIDKLATLDEPLDPERVRALANRPASRSAFDLVDALAVGDAARALGIARTLFDAGEAPVRVLAAIGWQLDLIARTLALAVDQPGISAEEAAALLRTSPYPTRKALAAAGRLDEHDLHHLVAAFVRADERAKAGGDAQWQLEALVLEACAVTGSGQAPSRRREKAASKATALGGKSSTRQ